MSNDQTVKFTTFGPNRGLTLQIGNYQFINGICEIAEAESSSATRVLCRYYDVCFEHELADQIKEYDAKHGSPASVGDDPIINIENNEVAKRNLTDKPVAEKATEKVADKAESSTDEDAGNTDSQKEASAKAEKKKGT